MAKINSQEGALMEWFELTIYTASEGIDALCGKLAFLGINKLAIDDPMEAEAFLSDNSNLWDTVDESWADPAREPSVKAYFPNTDQGKRSEAAVREAVKALKDSDASGTFGSLRIQTALMRDEDWEDNWKAFFKPIKIGQKLYIKPAWESLPESTDRTIIEIDPASSFGSGQHESTQLCLLALEEAIKGGEFVIDVGCGSGLLSVAALKLGALRCLGIDIDQTAIIASSNTAAINGVGSELELRVGDLVEGVAEKADIVVANLFANLITRLCANVGDVLKSGGLFVSSGITEGTLDEVLRSYEAAGFASVQTKELNGWRLVSARKAAQNE
ncbi:MAG: 50S ribosomal protein L11 methyltransferase [Eubacteriaceae bacterium]|nr:50S ribosomal protein L11 methyltransferase [Eubacteriaceae bacterium]